MRRIGALAPAIAAVVVAAAAVTAVAVRPSAGGSGGPHLVVSGSGLHVGAPPPAFRATAADGRIVDLRALRGRVVLLNFFATWCGNCRAEEPLLEQLAQRYGPRGLSVVGIDWHDSGDVPAFVRSLGVTYPTILDPESRIGDAYGVLDLPETVWIGRDGRVTEVFHGQLSPATVADVLSRLLGP